MKTIYIKTLFFDRFGTERHSGKINAELLLSTIADLCDDSDNKTKFDYLNEIVGAACKHADMAGEYRHTTDDSGKLDLDKELTWAEVHNALSVGKTVGTSHDEGCTVFVPMMQGLDETKEQARKRVQQTADASLHQMEFYGAEEEEVDLDDSDW